MNSNIQIRLRIVIYLAAAFLVTLMLRLYFLQVISGDIYAEMATENVSRSASIIAPRGNIYDRNGKLLVKSIPVAAVAVQPDILLDNEEALQLLAGYLDMPVSDIRKELEDANISYLERVFIKTGIDRPTIIKIEESSDSLPGVEVVDVYLREYEYGVLASHILGYTGEIDEEKLSSGQYGGDYAGGDQIGLTGLEEQYESVLKGEKGKLVYEVDPLGRPVRIIEKTEPVSGSDIYLTIDIELQNVAEEALLNGILEARDKTIKDTDENYIVPGGAAVVLDAKNGEILAMASYPTYDPEVFSGGISVEDWEYLNDAENQYPLNNRAVLSYPPGSTFKVVTSYAGLMENIISEYSVFSCHGVWFGLGSDFPKYCWNKSGHGSLNIRQAIRDSCDIYFYQVGYGLFLKLDNAEELLQKYARDFGFGSKTGIDLPSEDKGRIPDREWKKEYFKENVENTVWYPGDTVNMSIGQGDILVTPLQMAMVYATVANKGIQYQPHLVMGIKDQHQGAELEETVKNWKDLELDENYMDIIEDGLSMVVKSGGTAWYAFRNFPLDEIPLAGKSGTAEVFGKQDYAWFASYGPIGNPEYVIVIMLEQAGGGSSNVAPIIEKIYRYLFELDG